GKVMNMGKVNRYSYGSGGGRIRHFRVVAKLGSVKRGDVNGDGQVNSPDALSILQVVKELRGVGDPMYQQVKEHGDVTGDGRVDEADVRRIQECEVGVLLGSDCDF
ncbi:MAG: dockerin type I repeat-containing protein, partial [Nitrospira sp.]|nr:dockerin type I repeat-containing protein [Nitrospira sp.]